MIISPCPEIRTLRIQLTDECALNCVYCCNEGTKNRYSILTDTNVARCIRACYDLFGIKRVKFTGGEPLSYHGSIINIIKLVNNPNIQFSIVTNATSLVLKRLIDQNEGIETTISLPAPPDDYGSFHAITGCINRTYFDNIFENIRYFQSKRIPVKINYVLCKGKNTFDSQINSILQFASENEYINLRFLETVANSTNNESGQMLPYLFSEDAFIQLLENTSFSGFRKVDKDTRSSVFLYDPRSGLRIKYIRSFCSDECDACPTDKSSLWLTSTGCIKTCSFRSKMEPIKSWTYEDIHEQLARLFT